QGCRWNHRYNAGFGVWNCKPRNIKRPERSHEEPQARNPHGGGRFHGKTLCRLHPQSTEPPFTLMISPVMKLARSDAANRIGPAISSAIPGRPSGIALATIFCPALLLSTSFDISVATHPGATQFTKLLWRASSVANPFVKLIMAPFEAP